MSNQVTDILKLASQAIASGTEAVLATVVHTEGSAYRKPGAMMLICADGQSVGMISGGCLEPHIVKKALWLTRHGPTVQVYQTGEDEFESGLELDSQQDDSDFEFSIQTELNFGLGCNGRVHVLFERLNNAENASDSNYETYATKHLGQIKQVRSSLQLVTVATLVRSQSPEHPIGLRVNLSSSQNDDWGYDELIKQAIRSLSDKYATSAQDSSFSNDSKSYDFVTITSFENQDISKPVQTQWFVQNLQPQKRLLICGAGNDVQPLVTMAKMQDWHVTVIDSRSHYATRSRFMQADEVMCVPLEDEEMLLALSKNAAVAVMSHSLTQDRARLKVLLENPPLYLGQLGPKYRTERLIDEIKEDYQGDCQGEEKNLDKGIEQLHYPIGYKLGGDGPEALALGIMAQISAVMHDKEQSLERGYNKASKSNKVDSKQASCNLVNRIHV